MSRLYINGFEGGNLGLLRNSTSKIPSLNVIKFVTNDEIPSLTGYQDHEPIRCGKRVLALSGSTSTAISFIPETVLGFGNHLNEIYVSFKIQQVSSGYFTQPWFSIQNNVPENHFYIEDDTDGFGVHVLNVSTTDFFEHWALTHYRWNLIELWYKLSTTRYTSDGAFEFRVNGQTIASESAYATTYSTTSPGSYISQVAIASGGTHSFILIDDFIIDSTSAFDISSGNITRFKPISDDSSAWTPNAGSTCYEIVSNTGLIRDMPDRNYISADSVSEVAFDVGMDATNTLDTTSTIYSVQTNIQTSKYGEPTIEYVKSFLDISSSKYYGDAHKVPMNNFYSEIDIWETNPDTLTYWTDVDIESLLFGIRGE